MDRYICNFRTIDIDTTKPTFFGLLYDFYKKDIIQPFKKFDEIIRLLQKEYGLERVYLEEMNEMTKDWALSLSSLSEQPDYLAVERESLWQLPYNSKTDIFHKYFYERFVRTYERFIGINDLPKLILLYIKDKDHFVSDCFLLEMAVCVYRGIDYEDFNKKGPIYKNYLNAMFLLGEAIKEVRTSKTDTN